MICLCITTIQTLQANNTATYSTWSAKLTEFWDEWCKGHSTEPEYANPPIPIHLFQKKITRKAGCSLLECWSFQCRIIRVFPILYWISLISRIRWIQLESVKYWLNTTNNFSVSPPPPHSWLFGTMVMTPEWESVGCEFEYRDFCFWKKGLV